MASSTSPREGVITNHYFQCPFCGGHANLETHQCKCGAVVAAILWEHQSPELAMIARKHD